MFDRSPVDPFVRIEARSEMRNPPKPKGSLLRWLASLLKSASANLFHHST